MRHKLFVIFILLFVIFSMRVYAYSPTAGDLKGTITDNYGNFVYNAKVEIVQLNLTVYTSANGSYIFTNVTAGTYTLRVTKPNYLGVQEQVTILANQETVKDLVMQTTGTDVITQLISFVQNILTYGWLSIGISGLIGFFLVILAIYKLSATLSSIIISSFLTIVALIPSWVAYLTYGQGLGLHPLSLILYPYTWDKLLGLYVNVNAEVVQMCLVMFFISYLAMLQIAYTVVKKLNYASWMIPIIAFIGLLGFGLGLPNLWSFAFANFLLPLVVMIGFSIFTIVLLMFIKIKKTHKGITIRG